MTAPYNRHLLLLFYRAYAFLFLAIIIIIVVKSTNKIKFTIPYMNSNVLCTKFEKYEEAITCKV
jgi:hypothetical protein